MALDTPRPSEGTGTVHDEPTPGDAHASPRDASRLSVLRALLFDLDGVLTPTAEVHMRAWAPLFNDYFAARAVSRPTPRPTTSSTSTASPRYDGVRAMLAARGITLPEGTPDDAPDVDTVCGLGNRKNAVFAAELRENGVAPYPGSVAFLDRGHRARACRSPSSRARATPCPCSRPPVCATGST